MIKDIVLIAKKTPAGPLVYYNELWGMGQNLTGVLGTNDTITRSSPVLVGSRTDWSYVSTPGSYVGAITISGSLWMWGENYNGALGVGDTINRSNPVQVGGETNWKKVSTSLGQYHTIALKTDGTLWSWGSNAITGRLLLNDLISRSSPVQIGTRTWSDISSDFLIRTDGTLWSNGYGTQIANNFPGQINVSVYGFDKNVVSADTSLEHGTAIASDGTLWAWGNNVNGLFGNNTTTNSIYPVQIGTGNTWSLISAAKISAGGSIPHVVSIRTDGTLWSWGSNGNGQLGIGTSGAGTERSSPVQIGTRSDWSQVAAGSGFTISIRSDRTLWGWGNGSNGRLGQNNTTSYSSPVQIGTRSDWTQVAAGANFSIARRADGTLWSWGSNGNGQLGINLSTVNQRSSPVQIGTRSDWTQVAAGASYTMAIRTGTLWAWGNNTYGQQGRNTTLQNSSPIQVGGATDWSYIAAGGAGVAQYSIGFRGNTIFAWGDNSGGQFGNGNTTSTSSPVQISSGPTNPVSASCGPYVSFLIDNSSRLYTAGTPSQTSSENALGRTGGQTLDRSSPVQIGTLSNWSKLFTQRYPTVQKTDGTVWNLIPSPVQIDTSTDWKILSSENNNNIGIKTNGTLWSWGSDNTVYGVLGHNDKTNRVSPVQVGTLSNWSQISDISQWSVASIKTDGTLWAWGRNDSANYGALGFNDLTNRSSPTQVGNLSTWVSASVGGNTTMLIKRYT